MFPVSAVSDTEIRDDAHGRSVRVPVAGFGSEGLDELILWLKNRTREVSTKPAGKPKAVPGESTTPLTSLAAPTPPAKGKEKRKGHGCASIFAPIITVILCLLVLPGMCSNTSSRTVLAPDNRSWWEILMGEPIPTRTITITESSWGTIIIITLILSALAYTVARAIENEDT